MAAPRGPLDDPDRPERPTGRLAQGVRRATTTSKPRGRAVGRRLDEALEEAGRGTAGDGRTARRRWRSPRAAARRRESVPDARRGSIRSAAKRSASAVARGSNETAADRSAVVQRDDDAPAAAELDPIRPAGLDVRRRPPATARGSCGGCRLGQQPQGRQVDRGLRAATCPVAGRPNRSSKSRRPQRISVRRSAADASGRIVWWNGWASPLTPRSPATKPR